MKRDKKLSRAGAYMLASVEADLSITQLNAADPKLDRKFSRIITSGVIAE
jgi:acetamidase/formamidase